MIHAEKSTFDSRTLRHGKFPPTPASLPTFVIQAIQDGLMRILRGVRALSLLFIQF